MSTGTTGVKRVCNLDGSCLRPYVVRGLVRSYPGSHVVLGFAQALVSSRN